MRFVPATLRAVNADVVAKPIGLGWQGIIDPEGCEELNRLGYQTLTGKPWRHSQQIIKLLRSFRHEGWRMRVAIR